MELMFLLLTLIPEALGNLCTGLQSAVIPHPNSCKKFVICDEEQPTVLTCPGDLYFDIVIRSCILHSLAHCGPKHASRITTTPLPYRSITPSTESASTATSFESLPPISLASSTGMWRSLPPMSTTESSDSSEIEPSALPPILTSEPYPYNKTSESTTSDRIITTSSTMNTSYTEYTSHYTSPTLIHSTSSSEFVDLSTITDAPLVISTTAHMYTTVSTILNSEQSSVSIETTKIEPTAFPSTFSSETTYSENDTIPTIDFTTRKTSGMTSNTRPSTISDETPLTTDMFNTSASLSSVTFEDANSPTVPNSDNIVSSETLPPINFSTNTPTLLTESNEPMIETTHPFVTTTISSDDNNKITPSSLSSTLSEINNTYTTPIDNSEKPTGQPGSSLPPISTQHTHDSSVTSSPSIFSSTIFKDVTETAPAENIPSSTVSESVASTNDITYTSSFSESESDLVTTPSIFDQSTKNGPTSPTNMPLFDSSTTFQPSLSPSTTFPTIISSQTDYDTNIPDTSSSLVYSTETIASTPTTEFSYPTLPSIKTSSLSTSSGETIPPMLSSTTLIPTINPFETTPSQISTSMSQSTFDPATTSDIPEDQTINTKFFDASTSMIPFIPTTVISTPITEQNSHSSEASGTTEPISSLQTSITQSIPEESSSISPMIFSESTTAVAETDFSTNIPVKPSSHLPTTNLPPISSTVPVTLTQSTVPPETSFTTDTKSTTTGFMSTTLTSNFTEPSTYPDEKSTITLPVSSSQTSVMPLINSEATTDISLDDISEITTSDELSSLAPITDATRFTNPSISTTHISTPSSVTMSSLESSSTTSGSIDSMSTVVSSTFATGQSSYTDDIPTTLNPVSFSKTSMAPTSPGGTATSLFTTETSFDVEPSSLLPLTKETSSPQTNPTIPPISTTLITSPTTISIAPFDITTSETNAPIDSISTTVPSTLLTESSTYPNNILSTIVEESSSPTNVSSSFPEVIPTTKPLIISESTNEITENDMSSTNATIEPSSPNPITHVTEPSTSFQTAPSTIITKSTEDIPDGSPLPPIPTSGSEPPSPLPPLPAFKMSTLPPQTTTDTLPTTTLIPCHPYRYYTLVNPESTRTFYYCVLGTRYLFKCPHKYEFDPVMHVCTNP